MNSQHSRCNRPARTELSPITVRVSDACRITGIGRSKLYELIKAREIETIKVGAMTLIPVASLETFLGISHAEG